MKKHFVVLVSLILIFFCIITTGLNYCFNKYDYLNNDIGNIIIFVLIAIQLVGADYLSNYECGNLYIPTYEKTYKIIIDELEYVGTWDNYKILVSAERYRHLVHVKKLRYMFSIILGLCLWGALLGSAALSNGIGIIIILIILAACLCINAAEQFPNPSVNFALPQEEYEQFLPYYEKYDQMSLKEQIKSKHDALNQLEKKYVRIIESEFENHSDININVQDAIQIISIAVMYPLWMFLFMFFSFKLNFKYTIIFTGITYSVINIAFLII